MQTRFTMICSRKLWFLVFIHFGSGRFITIKGSVEPISSTISRTCEPIVQPQAAARSTSTSSIAEAGNIPNLMYEMTTFRRGWRMRVQWSIGTVSQAR